MGIVDPVTKDLSDEELVRRSAGGDEKAISELYDRYSRPVYATGLRLLGDTSLAEKLVQDAFTRVWTSAQTFDSSRASFATWLSLSGGRRRFWIPAAATLLVVAVLGIRLFQVIANDSSAGVPLTATALAPEASGEVRGERAGENIRIQLEVRGLPELREDEYYEMWYAREDGERISCGAFRPDPEGPTSVNFTTPINAKFYPEIEVTRQADDGNPQTSGQKVLEGELPA
jgi:hypothetical protein